MQDTPSASSPLAWASRPRPLSGTAATPDLPFLPDVCMTTSVQATLARGWMWACARRTAWPSRASDRGRVCVGVVRPLDGGLRRLVVVGMVAIVCTLSFSGASSTGRFGPPCVRAGRGIGRACTRKRQTDIGLSRPRFHNRKPEGISEISRYFSRGTPHLPLQHLSVRPYHCVPRSAAVEERICGEVRDLPG